MTVQQLVIREVRTFALAGSLLETFEQHPAVEQVDLQSYDQETMHLLIYYHSGVVPGEAWFDLVESKLQDKVEVTEITDDVIYLRARRERKPRRRRR